MTPEEIAKTMQEEEWREVNQQNKRAMTVGLDEAKAESDRTVISTLGKFGNYCKNNSTSRSLTPEQIAQNMDKPGMQPSVFNGLPLSKDQYRSLWEATSNLESTVDAVKMVMAGEAEAIRRDMDASLMAELMGFEAARRHYGSNQARITRNRSNTSVAKPSVPFSVQNPSPTSAPIISASLGYKRQLLEDKSGDTEGERPIKAIGKSLGSRKLNL